jgi:hypothetical protein
MIIFEELVYQEAQRRKLTILPEKLNRAEAEFRKQFTVPINTSNTCRRRCKARSRNCANRSSVPC